MIAQGMEAMRPTVSVQASVADKFLPGLGEVAGEKLEHGVEDRADQGEDGEFRKLGKTGPRHDEHGQKSDRDRDPAGEADPLAQQAAGEGHDNEWPREQDDRRIGQGQIADPDHHGAADDERRQAAEDLPARMPRAVEVFPFRGPGHQQQHRQGQRVTGEDDLSEGLRLDQDLAQSVDHAEQRHRRHEKQNPSGPVSSPGAVVHVAWNSPGVASHRPDSRV